MNKFFESNKEVTKQNRLRCNPFFFAQKPHQNLSFQELNVKIAQRFKQYVYLCVL